MSAFIIAFALIMFIGETMESAKRGNPEALLWPMFIFPANAVLFIIVGYRSMKQKEATEITNKM